MSQSVFKTICFILPSILGGFPGGSEVKVSACIVGDLRLIPGSGRSPGEGNGNPLQYSCLENPMDGGALWATVHGVAKSQTWLSCSVIYSAKIFWSLVFPNVCFMCWWYNGEHSKSVSEKDRNKYCMK